MASAPKLQELLRELHEMQRALVNEVSAEKKVQTLGKMQSLESEIDKQAALMSPVQRRAIDMQRNQGVRALHHEQSHKNESRPVTEATATPAPKTLQDFKAAIPKEKPQPSLEKSESEPTPPKTPGSDKQR